MKQLPFDVAKKYEEITQMNENFFRVKFFYKDLFTFVNFEGVESPKKYKRIYTFSYTDTKENEYGLVQHLNGNWQYIDKNLNEVGVEYPELSRFRQNIAMAKTKDNNWIYLNKNLEQVGEVFKKVEPFNKEGYARVQLLDNKYAIISKEGQLLKYRYDSEPNIHKNKFEGRMKHIYVRSDEQDKIINFEINYKKDYYLNLNWNRFQRGDFSNETLEDVLKHNPHFIKYLDCFYFHNKKTLEIIQNTVKNYVKNLKQTNEQVLPFWSNETYVTFLNKTLKTVTQEKQEEAKLKLEKDYYEATLEDIKRDYKMNLQKIKIKRDEAINKLQENFSKTRIKNEEAVK